jgi:hypothetical protein
MLDQSLSMQMVHGLLAARHRSQVEGSTSHQADINDLDRRCPLLAKEGTCLSGLMMSAPEGRTDMLVKPATSEFDPKPR